MSFEFDRIFKKWHLIVDMNEVEFLREYYKLEDKIRRLIYKEEALAIYHEVQKNIDNVRKMSDPEMKLYLQELYFSLNV